MNEQARAWLNRTIIKNKLFVQGYAHNQHWRNLEPSDWLRVKPCPYEPTLYDTTFILGGWRQ